jgi:flagellar basal body-associated protein FliL
MDSLTNKNKSKKIILIVIAAVVLLIAAGLAYVYLFNGNLLGWKKSSNESSINYQPPTDSQKSAGEETKANSVNDSQSNSTKQDPGDTPATPPTTQPDGTSKVEVSITAANQNGSVFQLRSIILAVVNTGTCSLTLTKGAAVVTKTAPVQASANSATCQGFDVPVSELSAGTWQATVSFKNDTLSGTTSKQITIQ